MLTALLLALSLGATWSYTVTECINAQGVPVRSVHAGDHLTLLGSGFGATAGTVTHCWSAAAILQWSDTRIDIAAPPVYPGMHAGLAPVVVHSADGNVELSPFKVELVSNTVRTMPGAARPKPATKAPPVLDPGFLRFYHGL